MDGIYQDFLNALETYHIGRMAALMVFIIVLSVGWKIVEKFTD